MVLGDGERWSLVDDRAYIQSDLKYQMQMPYPYANARCQNAKCQFHWAAE
jgi:hypothetical protein